jgi:Asp-tRNA(Asn)/Glu-tRNA(Gln) amidotransferase A subunit family amidase
MTCDIDVNRTGEGGTSAPRHRGLPGPYNEVYSRAKAAEEIFKEMKKAAEESFKEMKKAIVEASKDATEKEKDLKRALYEAEQKIASQGETIKKLRDDALEKLPKERYEVYPDSELMQKLASIFHDTETWAEEWAAPRFGDAGLAQLKKTFTDLRNKGPNHFATERFHQAAENQAFPPMIAVNAGLNRVLCSETFQRPFQHVDEELTYSEDCELERWLKHTLSLAERSKISPHVYRIRETDEYRFPRQSA